jgi:nitrite reductase/ring-hydroxylating ferredoxin subunit
MTRSLRVPVAAIGEIAIGRTKNFRYGINEGIAYNDQGTIKAFVNRCTHMGGPVSLCRSEKGTMVLRCRWHQAEFAPETGEAIEGEAPQGTLLSPIPLIEEGGKILAVLLLPEDPFNF